MWYCCLNVHPPTEGKSDDTNDRRNYSRYWTTTENFVGRFRCKSKDRILFKSIVVNEFT